MGSTVGLRQALAALDAALTTIGEAELCELSGAESLRLLLRLGTLSNKLEAQLTRAVGHAHTTGAALADGSTSTQAWLRARLHTGDAGAHVRAARTLGRTPEVAAVYARGETSLSHVLAVAAVVDDIPDPWLAAGVDKLLAEQAAQYPPEVFRRAALRIRDHVSPEAAERKRRHQYGHRWLDVDRTFNGSVSLNGLLDPDAGELLLSALGALMPPPAAGDPRTTAQRRADALTDLCRLGARQAPKAGGARPQVVVTVDLETLRRGAPSTRDSATMTPTPPASPVRPDGRWTGAVLGSHEPIGAETARRLACDALLIPMVLGTRGEPLDIGRACHDPTGPMRRALITRDGRCRFPSCDRRPQWTDAHHLRHWADGGVTALTNLILLCRAHHTLVHEAGFTVRLDPTTGNVYGYYPDGRPLDIVSPPGSCVP